ncbi:MAG: putative toxin-antitoxin system toxin component, PIN family [Actinomycetota bacterium]
MLEAVLDTNVFVSGTVSSSGAPHLVLEAWRKGAFAIVTSPPILEEIRRVFQYPRIARVYGIDATTAGKILARLEKYSIIVPGSVEVDVIHEDPADNMFLASASEAQADYLVTGDEHLLGLRSFEGTAIVSPRYFMGILEARNE